MYKIFQVHRSSLLALSATLILMSSFGTAVQAKGKFDGTYNIRTAWAADFCGTQDITFKVKNSKFSFRDSGNYRWAGRISSKGWVSITSRPSGQKVRGGGMVPRKKGIQNAVWGEIHWNVCGVGIMRVYRKR